MKIKKVLLVILLLATICPFSLDAQIRIRRPKIYKPVKIQTPTPIPPPTISSPYVTKKIREDLEDKEPAEQVLTILSIILFLAYCYCWKIRPKIAAIITLIQGLIIGLIVLLS